MAFLSLKEFKPFLQSLLRVIFAIALAWLWIMIFATPAYAQDSSINYSSINTHRSLFSVSVVRQSQ